MFYALIVIVAALRLAPHPMNVAPIGALGLFAGAYGDRRSAWGVSLAALLLGDVVHGLYAPIVMTFVYGGFACGGMIGRLLLRDRVGPLRITVAALAGATVFFLISNFGCWAAGMYPRTLSGLAQCYWMGLPLFPNSVLGDLFYSVMLFGAYALARRLALWASLARSAFSRRGR